MEWRDPFAAFLEIRTPTNAAIRPGSRSSGNSFASLERLEGLRSLCASPLAPVKDFPSLESKEDVPFEVDRLDGTTVQFEENPFASYLRLRPEAEKIVIVEPPMENHLRAEVLKTKKQLLEVALKMEMIAMDPETDEETSLRMRKLRKAQRYFNHPERSVEALSGDEDEDMTVQNKLAYQSNADARNAKRMQSDGTSTRGPSRRWSIGMVRRQPPPATAMSATPPSLSRPSTVYKDEMKIPSPKFGKDTNLTSASAPDLKPWSQQTELPQITVTSRRPLNRTWQGDFVVDEKSHVPLTSWFTQRRSWNIHISHRDLRAHRRDAELAAGGVVYGNGYIRLFSGSHLLCTGYFYAFKIDAVDDEHFPLDSLRDMSLAFGVSHLPGGHKLGIRTMYAYEIPGTILIGYGKHVVDSGEWFTQTAWDPKSLVVGDVVGVHINPLGDLIVWVNGEQVLRTVTSLTEGNRNDLNPRRKALGPRRTLFPVIDLHGRVSAVTLLPGMSMPNVNLKARNKIREKDLNPLGFRGKKAVPVPGRSLPGLGKAVEVEPETLPDRKSVV